MTGDISDGEIEKHFIISRRAPYIRFNLNPILYNIPINVSVNKAVFIYDSTFEGVVF